MKKTASLFSVPYLLWLLLFVVAPVLMLLYQSFFDISGNFTLDNYGTFFSSWTYLRMSFNSVLYAAIITLVTLLISYPTAYLLTRLKHKQLWLMLVILPTWVNLLLKAYAFMGIFGQQGGINALDDLDENIVNASKDLGANDWQTFTKIIFPLSLNGVRSGVQSVFIPSLSLFMLTRLIGGNRVITLGTAIEQHFLTTQNWGMGATIGVVLIVTMIAIMWLTKERRQ